MTKKGFGAMLEGLGKVTDVNTKGTAPSPAPAAATAVEGLTTMIRLSDIKPDPKQPRKYFDQQALDELANSLQEEGQLQPIVVQSDPDHAGRYLIVIGERRWRAASQLGWAEIEAKVKAPKNLRVAQLIENVQREGLTDGEVADTLAEIVAEGNINASQLAKAVKKSPAWVSDYLALRKAPPKFREALDAGTVANVHVLAEAIRLYKDYPDKVTELVLGAGPDAPVNQAALRKLKAQLGGEDARPKGGKAKEPGAATPPAGNDNAPPANAPEAVRVRIHVSEINGDVSGELVLSKVEATETATVKLPEGGTVELPVASLRIDRIEYP